MKNKLYNSILFTLLAAALMFLTGCSEEKAEGKNLQQLYKENGIPVKIKEVKREEFKKVLTYNSVLKGVKESSAFSMISDKVDNIHYNVGDYVKKDTPVISFPKDNPQAKYSQAKSAFEHAETTYNRMKTLYKSGGISKQDLDNAETQFKVAKANWDAAEQAIVVKAPISGYITEISVQETDNVGPGDKLFKVSNTNKMKTKIWISDKEIMSIEKNLPAVCSWNGNSFQGRVIQVDMAMDRKQQAFGAVCEFNNPDGLLKPGVTAEIQVETYNNPSAVVIERKNLVKEEDNYFIFTAKGNIANRKKVQLGKSQGLNIEILSGLEEGEKLITEGQLLLQNGSKINAID